MEFVPGEYAVTYSGHKLVLLAKEFALLRFLFDNRNQAFTREQLLDRVWPMEFPTERTVDDHVYRLRKKLGIWPDVAINTVRGYGYSLTLKETHGVDNPSLQDAELKEAIRGIFSKYHLLGQGKSMLTLATQKDTLGFEIDPFYQIYLRFIQGDIRWFLETGDVPMRERIYWMLLLYHGMSREPERVLALFEQALETGDLSAEQHREMKILNILDLYAETGARLKAIELLPSTYQTVEADKLTGFVMPVAITEMYVHLLAGHDDIVEQKAVQLQNMLVDASYLREIGRFQIVKGMWFLLQKRRSEAVTLLDEGLNVLSLSVNAPLRILSVYQILLFVTRHVPDAALHRKYEKVYSDLEREFGIVSYRERMEEAIRGYLYSV